METISPTTTQVSTIRVAWVDTLKFLGILTIYVGHFKHTAGKLDEFVFIFHVPLFFFIAGFFVKPSTKTFLQIIIQKSKQLLVPYLFFFCLYTLYIAIYYNVSFQRVLGMLADFCLGIRNTLPANSLWFFTCLFIVTLLHAGIQKITPHKRHHLVIAVVLHILIQVLPQHNPSQQPSWIWNIDSALYYYIYYIVGSMIFPWLNSSSTTQSKASKISMWLLFVGCLFIAIILYINGRDASTLWLIDYVGTHPSLTQIIVNAGKLFNAFILFFILIKIAKIMSPIPFLGKLGQETLVFCGTENLFKIAVMHFFNLISVKLPLYGAVSTLIYSLLLLICSYFILGKPLNKFVPALIGKIK
ncbi:MAG: acyltransferase family protein [Paludibacteraceae bacterium]|nr:acyltransferase family protein [Paludibacteraceae bacterium]MBN2786985.1 acyltransferase family protein [Paludibacteraceae bacterium]